MEGQPARRLEFKGYGSYEAGPDAPYRIKWNAIKDHLDLPPFNFYLNALDPLKTIDRFVNQRVTYIGEPVGSDLWQTPRDTLMKIHAGDCEDYAIAKYALLRAAGFAEGDLRIVIGAIKSIAALPDGRLPHAWCAAYFKGAWYALDNKFEEPIKIDDYINWLPMAAIHGDSVVNYGPQFTLAEQLAKHHG